MDLEHFTHRGYRPSLLIAFVLSGMIVVLASLLARGTLNVRGALTKIDDGPTNTAVIVLTEKELAKGEKIKNIEFLRAEPMTAGSTSKDPKMKQYSYFVQTTTGGNYLVQIYFDPGMKQWGTRILERLHGDTASTAFAQENEERK